MIVTIGTLTEVTSVGISKAIHYYLDEFTAAWECSETFAPGISGHNYSCGQEQHLPALLDGKSLVIMSW